VARCTQHAAPPWQGSGRGRDEGGEAWRTIRARVLAEEPTCRLCPSASVTVDHVRPIAQGGRTERSNLQGLCGACHKAKTAREAAEGRKARRGTANR
jgi:5-methylcytosine-specific restriction enzyme A